MDKFIKRANELIARLEQFGDSGSVENAIALQCAKDEIDYKSAVYNKETFLDCILDTRILISEFDCPPLYDECLNALETAEIPAPRFRYLLRKLIETAEFRRQGND